MILDIARLLLFPALMAFAAASDLFTMTISNRVSLALAAGFLVLAPLSGMAPHDILLAYRRRRAVLVVAFACFAMGWVGGGDAKVAAAAALWFGFGHLLDYLLYASLFGGALTLLLLQFRQWPLPYAARRPALAAQAARQGERHSLRHRARDRRADDLSGDRVDEGGRPRPLRDALIAHAVNSALTRFRYASLTML